MHASGWWSYKSLAEKFEVSKSAIRDAVKFRRWLGDPIED